MTGVREVIHRHTDEHNNSALHVVAIFYPFSQFCEITISLLSLQKQPNTAPNLFQRGVEYGKYASLQGHLRRHQLPAVDTAQHGPARANSNSNSTYMYNTSNDNSTNSSNSSMNRNNNKVVEWRSTLRGTKGVPRKGGRKQQLN